MVVKGSVQAEKQTTRKKKKRWYWQERSSHLKWPTVWCKLYTQEKFFSFEIWIFFPSGVLMESASWWGTSQKVLTVAGRSGASGRPVPGRVAVESRAPTETVITRCKSHYSLKGYGVFIPLFCIKPERRQHPVTHRTHFKSRHFVDTQCETNHLMILNYMARSAYRTESAP